MTDERSTAFDDDALDPIIADLNGKHAVVTEAGSTRIITETRDPITGRRILERSTAADFRLRYSNKLVTRKETVAHYWLTHPQRREYDGIVFAPGADPGPRFYNLWRGWAVDPDPDGDCRPLLDHLLEIGANGDEDTYTYLLDWCAWMVQRPHVPIESAIVWRGPQGAGKSWIGRLLGSLMGPQHYLAVSSMQQLVGRFSGHLQDALLVLADEALWAGDKASEGALKTIITEPTLIIERKGKDITTAPNYVHLALATNHDWAVPVGIDDRRFGVVDVPGSRVGDNAYFETLAHCAGNGGRGALLYTLLTRELGPRPPYPPQSAVARRSKIQQKLRTLGPMWVWWLGVLERGQIESTSDPWPDVVPTDKLCELWLAFAQKRNIQRRAIETELGQFMAARAGIQKSRKRIGGALTYVYPLPPLEDARRLFAESLRARPDELFLPEDEN